MAQLIPRRLLLLAGCAVLFGLLWAVFSAPPTPEKGPGSVARKGTGEEFAEKGPGSAARKGTGEEFAEKGPGSLSTGSLSMVSPQDTMAAQMAMLARDDVAAFRASFTVPVSDEQFAACKKRMKNAHLDPDWEMAETTIEGGHKVVRVSIFGKGMTGFHEKSGRYLADAVWCVPIW